eukprot:s263_g13.t1
MLIEARGGGVTGGLADAGLTGSVTESDALAGGLGVTAGALIGAGVVSAPAGALIGAGVVSAPAGALIGAGLVSAPAGALIGAGLVSATAGALIGAGLVSATTGAGTGATSTLAGLAGGLGVTAGGLTGVVAADGVHRRAPERGVADQLLRAGANPHKGLDKKGHGPLLAATLAGVPALVRHLLQAKASTASAGQDEKGRSVLSIAILDNNKEVVDELLSAKADPSHQDSGDKDGRNALHHCIQPFPYASYECTRLLTAMLRAPGGMQAAQAKDKKGLTPMALASRQGSGRMAQVLSAAGLQVTVSAPKLAAPTTAMPDVDADARSDLEKVEANAKPTPIPVHKAYSMSGENKVDLKRDEMRFYHLQLIHETNKDLFVLFTRWGEIGETGAFQRTPAANKEEGLKDFGKVFKEKTGNVWDPTGESFEKKPGKYQLLRRRRATARSEELVGKGLIGWSELLEEYAIEASESGRPGAIDRGRHVGFPLLSNFVLGGLEIDHNYLHGCRVGEASHPGPGSGGGARATAPRRAEQEGDDDDPIEGGGGGIAAMLRPMLEKMIKEIVMEIFGTGGLKGMLAGMLVGEQPASSSRAPRVAQPVEDAPPVVGQGKRW